MGVECTSNTFAMQFSGDLLVTALGFVEHSGPDDDGIVVRVEVGAPPEAQSRLKRLAGAKVTDARVDGRATIQLEFSNGDALRLLEDTDQYECYTLETADKLIVV